MPDGPENAVGRVIGPSAAAVKRGRGRGKTAKKKKCLARPVKNRKNAALEKIMPRPVYIKRRSRERLFCP